MLRPPFLSVLIQDDAISGPCKGDPDLLKCPHGIFHIYSGPQYRPPKYYNPDYRNCPKGIPEFGKPKSL